MANQPKKYKKFIATAATATLVASAIVPVASAEFNDISNLDADVQDAISSLVDLGVINGSLNSFNPTASITRGQVVKMLGKWVEAQGAEIPEDWNTDARFTDLSVNAADEELVKYAALAKDYGVFNGSNGKLNAAGNITRQQMALVLDRAYEAIFGTSLVDLAADLEDETVNDLDSATEEAQPVIQALRNLGITVVSNYNPAGNVTRAQFASFVYRSASVEVEEVVTEATVSAVTATNATTLTVTGEGLDNLKATDVTLAGNTVTAVTAAADGKSATITLGTLIVPNVEQTVKVLGTDYKVTYKLEVANVAVTEATYDDNRAKQFVAITVNGVTTTVADLLANGYSVAFSATDKDATSNQTATLFANTKTGELNTAGLASEYKVQVTLTNATGVVVSPVQTIKIKNLDLAASGINTYELVNTTGGSAVVQNSSTLRVGETAQFKNLKVVVDGTEQKNLAPSKVESSNKAVASVSVAGGIYTITANTPGTTTLTITYGNVTKDVTVTVVNEERKVKSIKVLKSGEDAQVYSATTFKAVNKTYDIQALDQFGDAVDGAVITVDTSDATIAYENGAVLPAASTLAAAGVNGKATFVINSLKEGNATLIFKEAGKTATIGTFGVSVTENTGVSTKKLEIVAPKDSDVVTKSADTTLDLSDDKIVEYNLNEYNAQGVKVQSAALGTYTATSSDATIATAAVAGTTLTITGVKKGTATVELKDALGVNVGTVTVTVVDNGATITSVNFKTQSTLNYGKAVDYKTFLTASDSVDPVLTGITLSKTTNNSIRVTNTGLIYLDKNGNSSYALADDKPLGQIDLSAVNETGTITVAANVATVTAAPTVTKGTIIFKIKDVDSLGVAKTEILASTSLNVDVK